MKMEKTVKIKTLVLLENEKQSMILINTCVSPQLLSPLVGGLRHDEMKARNGIEYLQT